MPLGADGEGVRLRIRVTPRAKRTALTGHVNVDGRPALAIRLAAPPVDGAANKALIFFLAEALGVPRSAIRIVAGETSRLKTVTIAGVAPEDIAAFIASSG